MVFLVSIFYINPLHQHNFQIQLLRAAIAVGWEVFSRISSVKWLSKLDNEPIIAGTRCASASSPLPTTQTASQQSTIPTQHIPRVRDEIYFPKHLSYILAIKSGTDREAGAIEVYVSEQRVIVVHWILQLPDQLLWRLARWTGLPAAMGSGPGVHSGSDVPIHPARCATQL